MDAGSAMNVQVCCIDNYKLLLKYHCLMLLEDIPTFYRDIPYFFTFSKFYPCFLVEGHLKA